MRSFSLGTALNTFYWIIVIFAVPLFPALLQAEPLQIGVVFGETGIASRWAEAQRKGLTMAAEDLGGDKAVVLHFEDSKSDAKTALSAIHKLISVDKVDAVIGDIFSHLTEAMIPAIKGKSVLLVSPSSPESSCSAETKNFFSMSAQIPRSLPTWEGALRKLGSKRVALVYIDIPTWGALYGTAWRAAATNVGASVVSEFSSVDLNSTDFTAVVPKLLREKPDTILLAHEPLGALRALRNAGYRGNIVSANNIQEIMSEAPQLLDGIYFVDAPASLEFQKRFTSRYGHSPLLEAQTSYEALRSVHSALSSKASLSSIHYNGVAGPIDFRSTCAGNFASWSLFRIEKQNDSTLKLVNQ